MVGLEGDAVEVQGVERVSELEELGLGVDACLLNRRTEPCVADLYCAVARVEVQEARRTDDAVFRTALRFENGNPAEVS